MSDDTEYDYSPSIAVDPEPVYLPDPLIEAVTQGDVAAVQTLLEQGADANIVGQHGHRPLLIAAANGALDIVRLLLDYGANINDETRSPHPQIDRVTPLIQAATRGHPEIVQLLLARGVDLRAANNQGIQALTEAFIDRYGLLKGYVPFDGQTALSRQANRRVILRLLTEAGVDYNEALWNAMEMDDPTIERHLYELDGLLLSQCLPRQPRRTALMEAALWGRLEIVRQLLAKGADVNQKTEDGSTALMEAVLRVDDVAPAFLEIAELLVAHNADVHARTKMGDSVLTLASLGGRTRACELLIQHGADVNAANNKGRTVLMQTIEYGCQPSSRAWEPFPRPKGNVETVQLLLAHGANVHARSHDGTTALQLAIEGDCPQVVEILRQAGASE